MRFAKRYPIQGWTGIRFGDAVHRTQISSLFLASISADRILENLYIAVFSIKRNQFYPSQSYQ